MAYDCVNQENKLKEKAEKLNEKRDEIDEKMGDIADKEDKINEKIGEIADKEIEISELRDEEIPQAEEDLVDAEAKVEEKATIPIPS